MDDAELAPRTITMPDMFHSNYTFIMSEHVGRIHNKMLDFDSNSKMVHSSIDHRNYFQTSKGHVTWIIQKVNRIPAHCGVAYECLLAC